MTKREKFITGIISKRESENDTLKKLAIRNKASPLNCWTPFFPYSKNNIRVAYSTYVDGVKLQFNRTVLILNYRIKK